MSTHVPGFQSNIGVCIIFLLAKVATSSIRIDNILHIVILYRFISGTQKSKMKAMDYLAYMCVHIITCFQSMRVSFIVFYQKHVFWMYSAFCSATSLLYKNQTQIIIQMSQITCFLINACHVRHTSIHLYCVPNSHT